jgi:hypothetical protein
MLATFTAAFWFWPSCCRPSWLAVFSPLAFLLPAFSPSAFFADSLH